MKQNGLSIFLSILLIFVTLNLSGCEDILTDNMSSLPEVMQSGNVSQQNSSYDISTDNSNVPTVSDKLVFDDNIPVVFFGDSNIKRPITSISPDMHVEAENILFSINGENIYVYGFHDKYNGYGSLCYNAGRIVKYLSSAMNIIEYKGTVYGQHISNGDSCHDSSTAYCRFSEDGTYDVVLDIWNVYYGENRVYFYQKDNENKYIVFSAN